MQAGQVKKKKKKKKPPFQLPCPGVNRTEGSAQNEEQAWSPAERPHQTLLEEPRSVLPSILGRQNKTGRALFVNSRNQKTFLVSGVKHSRANSVHGCKVCEEEEDPDSLKRTFSRSPKASGRVK